MSVKVRERPKGSGDWWIFIDHQGKRKSKKIGKDEKLAHKVAEKINAKLGLGEFDLQDPEVKKSPIFIDYSIFWLDDYIKPLRRESTYERYTHILKKHVYPTFGKIPIDLIKRKDIRNLLIKANKKG